MSDQSAGPPPKRLVFKPKGDNIVPLPEQGGMRASVHILDKDSVSAVNAALGAGRPLLVRGEPGTGKSQLARAAAAWLRRPLVHLAVDSRTESHDLLWSIDSVARLAAAQVMGAMLGGLRGAPEDMDASKAMDAFEERVRERIDVLKFLRPGVLWWAFDWQSAKEQAEKARVAPPQEPPNCTSTNGVVVLIDEIDKADASVPNGLLDALGHGRFDVPDHGPVLMKRSPEPLIVITTNEERSLPDAFLRRCLVLQLSLPEDDKALTKELVARGRAHFPKCDEEVLSKAAALMLGDRKECRARDIAPPGVAEYLDLISAVTEQPDTTPEKQRELLDEMAQFTFKKHPELKKHPDSKG